jgi:hypothetical protein
MTVERMASSACRARDFLSNDRDDLTCDFDVTERDADCVQEHSQGLADDDASEHGGGGGLDSEQLG